MRTVIFQSTSTRAGAPGWADRSGEEVEVVGPLGPADYDYDEVGPMFYIRFGDGTEAQAFGDELVDRDASTVVG